MNICVIVPEKDDYTETLGDVDRMAKYMIQLARDPQLAARMGKAAHERISEHFNIDKSISNLANIIKSAVKQKNHDEIGLI